MRSRTTFAPASPRASKGGAETKENQARQGEGRLANADLRASHGLARPVAGVGAIDIDHACALTSCAESMTGLEAQSVSFA